MAPIARAEAVDVVIESTSASSSADLTPAITGSGANVTITSGEVETTGDGSPGIYVPSATGDVTINSGSAITSGGPVTYNGQTYVSAGIAVVDGENVSVTSQDVSTSGPGGFGIAVAGVASATVDSGQITTNGAAATGITVDGVSGDISITSDSVETAGASVVFDGELVAAEGIYASGDGDITVDSGVITTKGEYAHGILVEGNVGNATVTSGQLSTEGDSAQGILVTTTSGDITINAGTTTTSGDYIRDNPYDYYPDAVTGLSGSGDISITSQSASADGLYGTAVAGVTYAGGDITIDSGEASGAGNGGVVLQGDASGGAGGNVTIVSDSIVNSGDGKSSLVAQADGDVDVTSGSIVSTGGTFHDEVYGTTRSSLGLFARSIQGDVVVDSGSISTVGDMARGLVAIAEVGNATVTSESVTTQSARGIQVRAAGDISIDSGSVHTAVPPGAAGALGIMVTAGEGDVVINSDEIVTEGAASHGIYVANAGGADIAGIGSWRAATGGTGVLTIDSGTINASGYGMMIDHQGAIDITSDEIVSGGPGIYLYGGDAITIDSGSISTTNGPGIVAWGDDGVVDITSGDVTVGANGDVGVFARTSSGDITINAGATSTTALGLVNGNYVADGVGALSQTGDITITSEAVSTKGYAASGLYAFTDGAISVTSGSVTTTGNSGNGIFVGGNGPITIDSAEIHTSGDNNEGAIIVQAGEGDVVVHSGSIEATGANSQGILIADHVPEWGPRPAGGGTGVLTLTSDDIDVTGTGIYVDHQGDMSIDSGVVTSGGPGIYVYGGGAVDLTSEHVESGGPAIVVWGEEGPVTVNSGYAKAGPTGDVGVYVATGSGDITIHADQTITTNTGMVGEITADAVSGVSDTGNVTIVSGSASAAGRYSSGVVGYTGGDVSITSETITNTGVHGNGIVAEGNVVTVDSGSITTSGAGYAYGVNAFGQSDVSVTSGSIVTTGLNTEGGRAFGIAAESVGGSVTVDSGSVSTKANRAYAIAGVVEGGEGDVVVHSESVSTAGLGARGITTQNAGSGDIVIVSGSATTTGQIFSSVDLVTTSDAIRAIAFGGDIDITSGTASTTGFGAAGIYADTTGDVTIDSGIVSTSGHLAPAIRAAGDNVSISSDQIHTTGDGAAGIYVPVATGDVVVDSGSILTSGNAYTLDGQTYTATAIAAIDVGGDLTINSDHITVSGSGATGIYGNAAGLITIDSGTIETAGVAGGGINVAGGAGVSITSDSVTTTGEYVVFDGEMLDAGAIYAESNGPITIDSGTVSTEGTFAHGIWAVGGEGDVLVTSDELTTSGDSAQGILVRTTSGDITINAGTTTTSGDYIRSVDQNPGDFYPDAVTGITESGNVVINSDTASADGLYATAVAGVALTSGTVTIHSGSASGSGNGGVVLQGEASAAAGGTVTIVSDSILNEGDGKASLVGQAYGDVNITSGSIVSTGGAFHDEVYDTTRNASGLTARSLHGDVVIDSGSISTAGDLARGLVAIADEGDVTVTSGTVTTQSARGIQVRAAGAISIDSGSVHTAVPTGAAGALGIMVQAGAGDVNITSDEIVTEGAGSHGIYVANAGGADIAGIGNWREATGGTGALTIDSGSINSSSWGMMIDHQGAIDITSDEIVSDGPGIYLYGGDAITIDSGSIETTYGPGIVAWGADGVVDITSGDVTVGLNGDVGVFAQTTGGDITINAENTTTTATGLVDGYTADAVGALSQTGDITITSGSTSTVGIYSSGVFALTGGDVSITSGSIENAGDFGNGIYVDAGGDITIDSGSVEVSGAAGGGMFLSSGGAVSVVSDSLVLTGASTDDADGYGIAVGAVGDVSVDSGLVSTVGDYAFGIGVLGGEDVTIVSGEVTTSGAGAFGIGVVDAVSANITTGSVTTTGTGDAIAVAASVSGSVDITVNGDVSSAHSLGVGVEAGTEATIHIEVAEGASVHGALGAIHIGTDTDTTLTVGGHLSSDADETVLLAGGDDVVNLVTGANIEGGLYGGAGLDTLNLDSTVNDGVGIGQSVDDVVGFEALNVSDGHWTIGGDLALETNLTGGTLVITGSLTDNVLIGEGAALQIGNGGETGDLIGDVQIDGTLIFNRSDEYDFGGDIWGSGSLVKEGAERLVLSGAYNFTGTTVVNGGTIKILQLPDTAEVVVDDGVLDLSGTDQTLASLSGGEGGEVDIDEGSLTVNQSGSTEFAGSITGDGSLTLTGGGVLNLTGENTYTGPTTIEEGLLKVNGSITSDVTVDDGGMLGGSGVIDGDIFVGDGGFVGPGNSPGTLTVDGDFTFASGSTYAAEVEANGDHDQIDVSGQTTIEDDVTLMVLAGNGDYARLSTYTILTSAGGIDGTFDNVTTNLAFLTPHVDYNLTSVVLNLTRNDITFASFALNANQTSVANVLEAADFGDPLYDAVVVQSAAGSQEAYAELSGELYASLPSVLLQQSRYGREAILDRAAHAPEGAGAWGQLIGSQLDIDNTDAHAGIESEGRGVIIGADAGFNGWRVGAALAQLKSDVDATSLASKSDVKSTSVSAYAAGMVGPLKATVGASHTKHDIDAVRQVAFPGFTDTTRSDFEGTTTEVFGELSLTSELNGVFLEPFIGAAYTSLDVDGFAETGGDAALTVGKVERDVSSAKVGLRAYGKYETSLGTVTPHASLAIQGVSGGGDALLNAAFAGAGGYTIAGAPVDDGVAFDLGARLDRGRLGVSAAYSGVEGDAWSDKRVSVGVSFRF